MDEESNITFRAASREDCPDIAQLYAISSDGVAQYIWTQLAEEDEDIYEVGARRYAREDTPFSYHNVTIAEVDGKLAGMMIGYPMFVDRDAPPETDPVLAPYSDLELDNSFYVCGIAVYPDFRGRGLGGRLMALAGERARSGGFELLSAVVFEDNRAWKLWQRLGFHAIRREKVVAHPLLHYGGDVLLIVKDLSPR